MHIYLVLLFKGIFNVDIPTREEEPESIRGYSRCCSFYVVGLMVRGSC